MTKRMNGQFQIITFYEFKNFGSAENLKEIKTSLSAAMRAHDVLGTIILAVEGYNATVCAAPRDVEKFISEAESVLKTKLNYKSSFHFEQPFRQVKVKIKPEIVTLKKQVKTEFGEGTRASAADWNKIISDPETIVLDARNDYEFKAGTFKNAVNPRTEKFSDLPKFVAENLSPERHKKIAMFCTGGVRCEKFAPFLKGLGFEKVYQLDGGILKYLEEIPESESFWQGECFVFDRRVTIDEKLRKGSAPDLSAETKTGKNPK